jgi:hypothetical protein
MTDRFEEYVQPIVQRCGRPEEKVTMMFDEMRKDFVRFGLPKPWCLKSFPHFICFLELDMRTPAHWLEFIKCEYPLEYRGDQMNFLMMVDRLLLYVHGWQYLKREQYLHLSKMIDQIRNALIL